LQLARPMASIFDFEVLDSSGKSVSLSSYAGKKAYLIVNVASACGYTAGNYKELVELQGKYDNDLQILAFPCNNFGAQEPGSMDEVCEFAASRGARFPILGKLPAEKRDISTPLYEFLKEKTNSSSEKIAWNFVKFLVDSRGVPKKRYPASASPLSFESDILEVINSA
jgi:glutathione peroxidase